MPQSYEYDEGSETWPFFVLTMLVVVLVPLSISQAYRVFAGRRRSAEDADPGQEKVQNVLKGVNDEFVTEDVKAFRRAFEKSVKSTMWSKRNAVLIVGWALVAFLVQRIRENDAIVVSATGLFDPYALLGVSSSASDRDIKSAYRKLSVKLHPDKLSKDLPSEERVRIEEMYVQISKAYEALTDEITKANYLTYGHPDGPQTVSHGIALPSFLVDRVASPLVILIYAVMLSIVLPYFVTKWWSRTQSYTKKGIHVQTASHFVDRLVNFKPSEIVTVDLIVNWLSGAQEFKDFCPDLKESDFEEIIHDHINRSSISRIRDEKVKFRIVSKCHSLLHGLLDLACGVRNTEIANATIDTFKCIVQAVPKTPHSQIIQLPNVDREKFMDGSVDEIFTLGKLFTYEDKEIGKILGIDDVRKLKQTLTVASHIPHLKLVKADFLVPGEPQVTPSSTPHISVKFLVRSAKHKTIPPEKFPDSMLEEPQDFEFQKNPFSILDDQPLMPYSYAPYFPTKRRNALCCLVALQKDAKLIQTPVIIKNLSLQNLSNDFDKREVKDLDENFKPEDWLIGTIKIPLGQPAPAETGDAFFRIIIKSTDYFTADLDFTMTMQVREAPVLREEKAINYDEDDMTEDESSDESENDDDEENEDSDNDYTDIDTDTEVEEDAVDESK